ncbi:MAG: sigma-70 family RNA polymerase sigma factor [Candidatus Gastranaerophilales bacterium]|nr:sigma-70 family RNA polymerase sigma factor [Candidatus Gastranaerophilales bacterium]
MNISKITTNVVSAISNNLKPNKLIGLDYSGIDEFVRADFSKAALAAASKEGRLTQDMIDQMIVQRLPRTIRQAEMFVHEHPELSKEDVTQDLIEHMVTVANQYKGQRGGNFNSYSLEREKIFLERLLKRSNAESEYFVSGVDLSKIQDNFPDMQLRVARIQGLSDAMETLTTREQGVLEARFGFDGKGVKTLEEVAEIFNTTRERIRQVENKAIRRLRHPMRTRMYRAEARVIPNGDFQDKMAHLADKGLLGK